MPKMYFKMATDLIFQKQTMSSLEIAQLIGKQHAHVMRDIRSILEQGVAESNFGLGSYSDANGQNRPCYNLTKKGCLILASGYDAKLREKIIDRWEELETKEQLGDYTAQQPLSPSELILRLAQMNVENERKMKELSDNQQRLESEIEEIRQRTITDLHKSTIVAYVSRNNIKLDVKRYGAMGRKASSICKKKGIPVTKINDIRWGKVSVFPDEVLDEVFGTKVVPAYNN